MDTKEEIFQELFAFVGTLTDDDPTAGFHLRVGGYAVYLKALELLNE